MICRTIVTKPIDLNMHHSATWVCHRRQVAHQQLAHRCSARLSSSLALADLLRAPLCNLLDCQLNRVLPRNWPPLRCDRCGYPASLFKSGLLRLQTGHPRQHVGQRPCLLGCLPAWLDKSYLPHDQATSSASIQKGEMGKRQCRQ